MTTITNNKNNIKKSLLDDLFVDEILNEKKLIKKNQLISKIIVLTKNNQY